MKKTLLLMLVVLMLGSVVWAENGKIIVGCRDKDWKPIAGASLRLFVGAMPIRDKKTDSNGNCEFTDIVKPTKGINVGKGRPSPAMRTSAFFLDPTFGESMKVIFKNPDDIYYNRIDPKAIQKAIEQKLR